MPRKKKEDKTPVGKQEDKEIPVLDDPIYFRPDKKLNFMLDWLCEYRGEKKSDLLRSLLKKAVEDMMLEEFAKDRMLQLTTTAITDVMKPIEQRLRAITGKSTIASGTAMYLLLQYIGELGNSDVRTVHEEARKRAVAFAYKSADKDESNVQGT